MASAGSVRAGGAFVEIFARDTEFHRAMTRVQARLKAVGASMQKFGTGLMIGGTALGLPMVLAARQAATFEDAILGLRAAAGLSADEVAKLEAEALRLSRAMDVAPANVANAMLELAKAGMSVDEILGGAAKSAIEFARVSGVDMADAAVFMKVAMNSFGVSAVEAVDTLSAAADASETSIAAMVESFALVGSAGALFNQSLFDISQGLAVLARFGIRGEEAGTGIKTLLVRLVEPSKEAEEALASVGLALSDFRDADGKLLPLVQIVGVLQKALEGVDQQMRDRILGTVFGDRGIRVIGAFLKVGVDGFGTMADAMESNLPVSQKFQILMSGLSGAFSRIGAAVQRLSISFAKALGSSASGVISVLEFLLDVLGMLIERFPLVTKVVVGGVAVVLALGAAAIVLGLAFKVAAAGVAVFAAVFSALSTVAGAAVAIVVGGIALILTAAYQLSPAFRKEVNAIMAAMAKLDFATAWEIMNLNLAIALTQMTQSFSNAFAAFKNTAAAVGSFIGDKLIEGMDRFLGLFGADILWLQGSLEKLGLYFRSAFDFSWATGELQRQLAAVDARIEAERKKAGTADERAANRADRRRSAADARQARDDERNAGFDSTIEQLRSQLKAARDRATAKDPMQEKTSAKRSEFRPQGGPAPQQTPASGVGFGAMLATFAGGIAEQVGIGPELNVLEESSKATADNTKRAADGIDKLIGVGDFGNGGMPNVNDVQRALAGVGAAGGNGAAPPVADGDRNLVSAAEQTAGYAAQTVDLLRRLVSQSGGGMAFA